MTYTGRPSGFPYLSNSEDTSVALGLGGNCIRAVAHETLKIGDVVFWTVGGRVGKSLESALYSARLAGVIVGGASTNYEATNDSLMFGDNTSVAGEHVIVQVRGIVNCIADATTVIRAGDPITAGRTTAGRVRPDMLYSAAVTAPGLTIVGAASALVKAANATQTVVSGVGGTTTAANLNQAALSGTVTNAKFNVYVFRVAADGLTVTSAMGTEGATLNDVVWPVGVPTVAALGCVIINPTGTGNFIGGTTALDDATVVPNAKYVDFVRNRFAIGYAAQAYSPAAGDAIKVVLI